MRKLSNGGAISEARRFKTLMMGRGTGSGTGAAMPQATAQNQMVIAGATPVWTLLAAPTAEGQVLITGADPYTPAWDTTFPAMIQLDAGLTFGGVTGVNVITVPDNTAQAVHLVDAGGIEYLRIVSINTQPAVVFNEVGHDVDHRWEASGEANALFIRGSDGRRGMGTDDPAGEVHVIGTAVTNVHRPAYGTPTLVLDDGSITAVTLQLAARDSSTRMCHIVITGAPTTGNNKHWIVSHLGPDAGNRFSIGYLESAATDFSTWADVNEHFIILPSGNVGIGTAAPATVLDIRGNLTFGTVGTGIKDWNDLYRVRFGADYMTIYTRPGDGSGSINIFDSQAAANMVSFLEGGNVGIGTVGPGAKLDVDGGATDDPLTILDSLSDDDAAFINFAGVSAADTTKSLSTYSSWIEGGHIKVQINGTDYWIRYFTPS